MSESKKQKSETVAEEPKPEIIKRECKYTFTREEIEEINKELLAQLDHHAEVVERKKSITADMGARVKTAETEIRDTRTKLKDGFEFRQMDVRVEKDFKAGVKRFIRVDNGELVDSQPLSAFDRQGTLSGTEGTEEKPFNPVIEGDVPATFIELWNAGEDKGVMALERRGGMWYYGADLKIGNRSGHRAISTAKPVFKDRFDAVKNGAKFVLSWINDVEPEAVDGFKARIQEVVAAQWGVVE